MPNITKTFLEISEPQRLLQTICYDVICFSTAKEIRFLSLQRNGKTAIPEVLVLGYNVMLLCVGRLEVEIQAQVSRGSA